MQSTDRAGVGGRVIGEVDCIEVSEQAELPRNGVIEPVAVPVRSTSSSLSSLVIDSGTGPLSGLCARLREENDLVAPGHCLLVFIIGEELAGRRTGADECVG
jgi:hypothetical protein